MKTILKTIQRFAGIGLGVAISSFLSACNGPVKFPLEYRPSDEAEPRLAAPGGRVRLFIQTVEDGRQVKSPLGHTTSEGFQSVPVVASAGTPAGFIDDAFRNEFNRIGVVIVDSPADANRILAVSIRQFTVNEGDDYHGRIVLVATVLDSGDKLRWEQTATGENSTHGWSYNPANYQQVLSDAFVELFANLMSTPPFVNALSVGAPTGYRLPE